MARLSAPPTFFGHRLRDGLKVDVPADAWTNVPIVIVGGGVAGLTAAWRLQSSGFDNFVLVELESAPGGTPVPDSNRGISYSVGSALHSRADEGERRARFAARRNGNARRKKIPKANPSLRNSFSAAIPKKRVFYKHRWYEGQYTASRGVGPGQAPARQGFNAELARWVTWRDAKGRRPSRCPCLRVQTIRKSPPSIASRFPSGWTNAGSIVRGSRWWVDYACRDDYGMKISETSAWAGLFYFCSRVAKPGVESQFADHLARMAMGGWRIICLSARNRRCNWIARPSS
jgi:choline dehydrogenase-like flavoprotein